MLLGVVCERGAGGGGVRWRLGLAMSAARLKLVELRAVLGGERDPFGNVWDFQATKKDRALLLMMAGKNSVDAGWLSGRAWSDLSAENRGNIQAGLRRFSGWAAKLK